MTFSGLPPIDSVAPPGHYCQESNELPREDRERRFISNYLLQRLPDGGWTTNVPLGPIPEEIVKRYGQVAGSRLFQPSRPRIDAVYPTESVYWLIEAKIREAKAAIGDLLVYRSLALKTLDLPGYTGQPFGMRLVVPWALEWIKEAATAHGMDLVVFLPAWVEDYVRLRQNYFTKEVREARDEKMRLRGIFGVE